MARRCVPFSPCSIDPEDIAEIESTLRSNWITTGPKTKRFEQEFASYLGVPTAAAVASCTAGLHLGLLVSNIGPGDEVITTPLTFAATVNVIEHVGARPVLVDVDPVTLNIDPARIEQAISPRTRAILPVHFAGHPVDLDAINAIAQRHGLVVIEDAAHAFGAAYRGVRIGGGENLASFSFYATKNLTTAEGGMITGPPDLVDATRVPSLHGLSRDAWQRQDCPASWHYDVQVPGFKYNMTDLQASLGLAQLRRFDQMQRRRQEIVATYTQALAPLELFDLPTVRPECQHAWQLYVVRLRPGRLQIGRDQFIDELAVRGIATSVHFIPIHFHSYYRNKYGYRPDDFPVAMANFQRMFSLPLSAALDEQDVEAVLETIHEVAAAFEQRSSGTRKQQIPI